jgi:hypothetical protein
MQKSKVGSMLGFQPTVLNNVRNVARLILSRTPFFSLLSLKGMLGLDHYTLWLTVSLSLCPPLVTLEPVDGYLWN